MAIDLIGLEDLTDPYRKIELTVLPSRIDRIEKAVRNAALEELRKQKDKRPNEKTEHIAALLRFHLKGEAKIPKLPDEIEINDRTGTVKDIRTIVKILLSIVFSAEDSAKPLEKIGIGQLLSSMPGYYKWTEEVTHYTSLTYIILMMLKKKHEREYISAEELHKELQHPTKEIMEMEAFTIFQATTYKTISIEKIKAALDRLSKIRNQEWRFILKKEDEKYAIFQQKPQKNENETEDDDNDDTDDIDKITEDCIVDGDEGMAEIIASESAHCLNPKQGELDERSIYNFVKGQKSSQLERYMRDVCRYKVLTREEEAELAKKAEAGDENARKQIVNANLRFVIKIAFQYKDQGLPLMDVIQAGNIGMIMAAKKFEHERGYRFISYAVWWIRAIITDEIRKQRGNVRLPSAYGKAIMKIKRYIKEFKEKNGREPTHAECKARFPKKSTLSIEIAFGHFRPEIRFEDEVQGSNDKKNKTFADSMGQNDTGFDEIEAKSLKPVMEKITTILKEVIANSKAGKAIKDRNEYIILRRYDILRNSARSNGTEDGTLQDIGDEFGLSRERIRQMTRDIIERAKPRIAAMLVENTGEASVSALFKQNDGCLANQ
ncbi:MAG: RNA polymerase sigma factor RpoD [Candidatus Peregrinibacteria bacterium GW2011_GWC2_39_14]|nr:MAG: RNA polymerase sigma factor RpoD [Candidatus Peregrinibacteria bacterium GW2011_GWC2_39_14]